MADENVEPTEEELRAALEEQMRNIRVEEVIFQTIATLVNLAARRLGLAAEPGADPGAERDIEQARLAIDAVRALLPLSPQEQMEPVRQALTQLQMAFARETQGAGGAGAGGAPAAAGPQPDPEAEARRREEEERAKARSKIWTPGS